MLVVTGATGKLGRLVIDALLQRVPEAELAVAIRTPSKAEDLSARRVQVRHADYNRPETLSRALKRREKVLLISANEVGNPGRSIFVSLRRRARRMSGRADRSTLILAEENRTGPSDERLLQTH